MEGTVVGMNNVRTGAEEELEDRSIRDSDAVDAVAEEGRQEEGSGRRDLNSDDLVQVQEDMQGNYSDKLQEHMWGWTDMQTPLCIPYDHHMDVYEHESRRPA